MPPKRKRAEEDPEADATAPASSKTRATKAKAAPVAKKQPSRKAKSKNGDDEAMTGSEMEVAEAKPRTRTSQAKVKPDTDEPPQKKAKTSKGRAKETPSDVVDVAAPKVPTKAVSAPKDSLDPKSYSDDRVVALFERYADADDPNVMSGEGLERLCSEGDIPMDGARPLVLAWHLNCKTMGTITRTEWTQGLQTLRIDTVQKLAVALADLEEIVLSNSNTTSKPSKNPPYAQDKLLTQYATDSKASFSKLYHFLFNLCRAEQQRNIDVETACALWSVVLPAKWPLASDLVTFIDANKQTYKGITKDHWVMTLEFCMAVDPSMDNYNADDAWPTMLDDFYTWKKAQSEDKSPATDAMQE